MQDPDNVYLNYLRSERLIPDINPDSPELAYQLQNASPDDLTIIEPLVQIYTVELLRWIREILYYQLKAKPSQPAIMLVLTRVFATALQQVNQFKGSESIASWLFGVSYQYMRSHRLQARRENLLEPVQPVITMGGLQPKLESAYWNSLDHMPDKLRLPLILRYQFGFDLSEIGRILNIDSREAHQRLVGARKLLTVNPTGAHMQASIQDYIDGLLDAEPEKLSRLAQHVKTCEQCQKYYSRLNNLEKTIGEAFTSRWSYELHPEIDHHELVELIKQEINHPAFGTKIRLQIRQSAWIMGIVLMFIGMSIVILRFTTFDAALGLHVETPTQPPQPAAAVPLNYEAYHYDQFYQSTPRYVEPAFSMDGNWAVFTSIRAFPSSRWVAQLTIELFDRKTNTIQKIGQGARSAEKSRAWWDLAPGISGDGHLIAYVAATTDINIPGAPCITADHEDCLDILLYDQLAGKTKRITKGFTGGPADGDSLSPVLSADGRWLAFWSTADNLLGIHNVSCQPAGSAVECVYPYLYDLSTGNILQLSIPTIGTSSGLDRISLSEDGRYVAYTVIPLPDIHYPGNMFLSSPHLVKSKTDSPGASPIGPVFMHSKDAVVYDRDTGLYELVNQSSNGTLGDGESSSPALSANGDFVVFSSSSTNLIPDQTIRGGGIFVKDRLTGGVEVVRICIPGGDCRSDLWMSISERGYPSMNISDDGRFIIFTSTAAYTDRSQNTPCNTDQSQDCKYLYVSDLVTGTTEEITAYSSQDFILFPQISTAGRWISFMQSSHNCASSQYFCSNVMLFDRYNNWMSDLTRINQTDQGLPWKYFGSIPLPSEKGANSAIKFSPDGKQIALAGTDSMIRIWRVLEGSHFINNGQPDLLLSADQIGSFSALAFSPGGDLIAAASNDGVVNVWELPGGMLRYSAKDQSELIRKIVFSQDGKYMVLSTLEETWIDQLDGSQLTKIASIPYGIKIAFAVDVSPGADLLATSRGDGSIWLQKLPGGDIVGKVTSTQLDVSSLAFSNDGSLLASRSTDESIDIWRVNGQAINSSSLSLISSFRTFGYAGPLVFSPDDKYLAAANRDGGVTYWNVGDGTASSIDNPFSSGEVYSLAFSASAGLLAETVRDEIILWSLPEKKALTFFRYAITDRFFDAKIMPDPSASDIPALHATDDDMAYSNLSFAQVSRATNLPFVIPTRLPENISFNSGIVYKDGSILLLYEISDPGVNSAWLYIFEKSVGGSDPPTMTIGEGADVIDTHVVTKSGVAFAEYVRGDWIWRQSYTEPPTGTPTGVSHNVWSWDNTSDSKRIRWQQDGVLVAIYYQAYSLDNPPLDIHSAGAHLLYLRSTLEQSDLEQIASGMHPYSEIYGNSEPGQHRQAVQICPLDTLSSLPGQVCKLSSKTFHEFVDIKGTPQ